MLSTQSTSVMSIGAITSPCSKKAEYNLPSLCSITDSVATTSGLPQENQQNYASVSVGQWVHNNDSDLSAVRYPTHTIMSSASLSNRPRYHSISVSSPSFSSSSSSNSSDHDEDDDQQHNQQHHSTYQHSRQNSLFSAFDSTFSMGGGSNAGTSSNSISSNSNRSRPFSNKSDALATRRARNKLASAKYRAKKQALTHAMQDRIMQLATQVMNLREELAITKRNELEFKARYERLLIHSNSNNNIKTRNNNNNNNNNSKNSKNNTPAFPMNHSTTTATIPRLY